LTVTAPIIVTALFGKADAAWFDGLRRRHYPAERNHVPAHLTMFHHLPPSAADEIKRRLSEETRGQPAPAAKLGAPFSLGRGVAFRVESPQLQAIRADLAGTFDGVLTPQDQARWRAHVTVQNKAPPAEAKALLDALRADFSPRALVIAGLASWHYLGGPWALLSRHMFA